jgi:hypothetical protein
MTDRYTIVFEVDARSVRAFAETRTHIVIARHGADGVGNVAWLAWPPSGSDIVVWDESYGLYAATAAPRDGQLVKIAAALETARDRSVYPFDGDAFGERQRTAHIPARHYDVRNDSAGAITFGLLQPASVNGSAGGSLPRNAGVVPSSFSADFMALTRASVWTQPDAPSGSIVQVPATAAVLALSAHRRTARCRYDRRNASFSCTLT